MPLPNANADKNDTEDKDSTDTDTTADPPEPAKAKFSQEDVNRLIAKEQKKLGAKLQAELDDLRKKAADADALRTKVEEFESRDTSEVDKLRKRLADIEAAKAAREGELARTIDEQKAAADAEVARMHVKAIVAAKVAKENSPAAVERLFGENVRRSKDDPKVVVWVDPETDEEVPLDKALDAFLTANPIFLSAPPSGTGAVGGAPGRGQKPYAAMTPAEIDAEVNRRHASGQRK